MILPKEEYIKQIRSMQNRPRMFAQTREGFLFQISAILHFVFEFDRIDVFDFEDSVYKKYTLDLALETEPKSEFVTFVCESALKLIYSPLE